MHDERFKIPVVVQQVVSARDASGGNNRSDSLANGNAEMAERPKISCCLNRYFLAAQFYDPERGQGLLGFMEVAFLGKALQNLCQHKIANGQRLAA